MSRPYRIYGLDLSYFTRKMEAAFEFHEVPHRRRSKTAFNLRRLERRAGTRKIPVVVTPEGRYLSDTTPIIDRLDRSHPGRRLIPEGLDGVVVRLVEEWLDEWFPRTVIHYRWHDPESSEFASQVLVRELMPMIPGILRLQRERQIAGWGQRACRAVGVGDPPQWASAEADGEAVWTALEAQLGRTRYALGDRATSVDAVLLGALRGHFLTDPAARRVVEQLPRVTEWTNSAARWDGGGELPTFPEVSEFANVVLDRMRGPYRTWLLAHSAAVERGERQFEVAIDGGAVDFRVLHRPSPTDSNAYLCDRIDEQIRGPDRQRLQEWLAEQGLNDVVPL